MRVTLVGCHSSRPATSSRVRPEAARRRRSSAVRRLWRTVGLRYGRAGIANSLGDLHGVTYTVYVACVRVTLTGSLALPTSPDEPKRQRPTVAVDTCGTGQPARRLRAATCAYKTQDRHQMAWTLLCRKRRSAQCRWCRFCLPVHTEGGTSWLIIHG